MTSNKAAIALTELIRERMEKQHARSADLLNALRDNNLMLALGTLPALEESIATLTPLLQALRLTMEA